MTGEADLVTTLLARAAAEPHRVAVRDHRGRSVTYGELGTDLTAVAAHLTTHGLEPGDGVLLAVRPSPRAVAAALGVVLAGGVVVVADPGAGQALLDVRRRTAPVRAAVADTVVHAATRRPFSARPLGARPRARRHRPAPARGAALGDPLGAPATVLDPAWGG
jgi:acyl-CoA synthetase (AMP-forming)/AMP-acid ligase II